MKQIAIIGPTASGKSALAIDVAKRIDAYILSLDSLSIYKEIDIASAKPTVEEMSTIKHFGIDILAPDSYFSVKLYIELYREVSRLAKKNSKNLVIVGGSSFYLKSLLDGISQLPIVSDATIKKRNLILADMSSAYKMMYDIDMEYMSSISPKDSYRIEKALDIYLETGVTPTKYFALNPPIPIIEPNMPIYEIEVDRGILRDRIEFRTDIMLSMGLIDEVSTLEHRYTRSPNSMKSIGIKETLEYLDGVYNYKELRDKIVVNTSRLAKRQVTFNKSQFLDKVIGSSSELLEQIIIS